MSLRRETCCSLNNSTAAAQRASVSASIHHKMKGERNATIIGTAMNTLCNVMGAGVLSLPYAMHNGSVTVSLLLMAWCAGLSLFSIYVLIFAADIVRKYSYTEVVSFSVFPDEPLTTTGDQEVEKEEEDEGFYIPGKESVAHRRRRYATMLLECVIFFNSFGGLIIYSRVIADSMPSVMADFFGAKGIWLEDWFWLLIPSLIFFGLSCVRNLSELIWSSVMGFLTILYIIVVVIARFYTNLDERISDDVVGTSKVSWFHVKLSCFSTLSAYALAFGYHYNVPYFYCELRDRRPYIYMKAVMSAFPIIIVCYGVTGLLGYLTFGSTVAIGEGNIVKNFMANDQVVNAGRFGLFLHFLSVYPIIAVSARRGIHRFVSLLFYRPEVDSEGNIVLGSRFDPPPGDPRTTRRISIVLEALLIVTSATLIAYYVPGIAVVVEFSGALLGLPIMFVFPGIVGICVFRQGVANTKGMWHLGYRVFSYITFTCGILFTIFGLIAFFNDHFFRKNES